MDPWPPSGDDPNPDLADDAVLAERVRQAVVEGEADFLRSWEQLATLAPCLQRWDMAAQLHRHQAERADQPLSAWLYLSDYRIGRLLAAGADPEDLPVDAQELIRQIAQSPPPGTVLAFGDAAIAPPEQWQALLELFQEGGDFIADLEASPRCARWSAWGIPAWRPGWTRCFPW